MIINTIIDNDPYHSILVQHASITTLGERTQQYIITVFDERTLISLNLTLD